MLTTEKIIELLQKHIAKGCRFKDTPKGCLCESSIAAGNPVTVNSLCRWDVKEYALQEENPDPDVVVGCAIGELERNGWMFTHKPIYRQGVGIIHKGMPPIGYADASQVWIGRARDEIFIVAADRNGWMMGTRPSDKTKVEVLKESLVNLIEKIRFATAHDIPDDIALDIGSIMNEKEKDGK